MRWVGGVVRVGVGGGNLRFPCFAARVEGVVVEALSDEDEVGDAEVDC